MSKLLYCIVNKAKPTVWTPEVEAQLQVTKLEENLVLVNTVHKNTNSQDLALERDSNNVVIDLKTKKILCRPFNGGSSIPGMELTSGVINVSQKLETGIFVYLYKKKDVWTWANSKEAVKIETSSLSGSYTYCFEVRDETLESQNLFLVTARNNNSGAYLDINTNPSLVEFQKTEQAPLITGVALNIAVRIDPPCWGLYLQYGNNTQGTVIKKQEKKPEATKATSKKITTTAAIQEATQVSTPVIFKRPDINVKQSQYLAKSTLSSGISRASLVLKPGSKI